MRLVTGVWLGVRRETGRSVGLVGKSLGGFRVGRPRGGGGVRRGFEQVTCFKERHGDGGVVRLAASGSGFGDFVMY